MNILIIGCSYIGTEVGALWKKNGHTVTVTTSHLENLDSLLRAGQKSVILKGNAEEELTPLITANDLILIEEADLHIAKTIRYLALEMDLPRHLIYLSSTAVYGDHHGQWVDEASELKAKSDHAQELIEMERNFLSLEEVGWRICLLRLSEIYGPGRELSHRVAHLKDHSLPGAGDHHTNMIHKTDCVFAVDYALRHHLEGIFNLSDDQHPTRKDLYHEISEKFHLPKVKWDSTHTPLQTGNKRVSNHKIKAEGFALRHPLRVLD